MIYQLLIRLLAPVIVIAFAIDAYKRHGGWRFVKQRCGLGYFAKKPQHDYWVHCASVGEVNAALPILKRLPENRVIVTTNTPTGKAFLNKHLPSVEHAYFPFDWPFAIRRFFKTYQPQQLWVMETEIWPNLYQHSYLKNVKIHILNGRLSPKTLQAPRWLKTQYKQALLRVDHVYAKSAQDKQRFIELGAPAAKVLALGNIKFAQVIDLAQHPKPIPQAYLMLASSHDDEERQITQLWQQLKTQHGFRQTLVIAPRHPQRCHEIQQMLAKHHVLSIRLSQLLELDALEKAEQTEPAKKYDVVLVDEIGKLQPFYQHAELVIMGGSFVSKGGHNLLEPCAYGSSVLTGPDMHNFLEETALLKQANAIYQCDSLKQLKQQLTTLLSHPEQRQTLGENAQKTLLKQSKVLDKYTRRLNIL